MFQKQQQQKSNKLIIEKKDKSGNERFKTKKEILVRHVTSLGCSTRLLASIQFFLKTKTKTKTETKKKTKKKPVLENISSKLDLSIFIDTSASENAVA